MISLKLLVSVLGVVVEVVLGFALGVVVPGFVFGVVGLGFVLVAEVFVFTLDALVLAVLLEAVEVEELSLEVTALLLLAIVLEVELFSTSLLVTVGFCLEQAIKLIHVKVANIAIKYLFIFHFLVLCYWFCAC